MDIWIQRKKGSRQKNRWIEGLIVNRWRYERKQRQIDIWTQRQKDSRQKDRWIEGQIDNRRMKGNKD